MEPDLVEVMRSCKSPISVARFGWYPTAEGMRPSNADTSDPAWVNRKMLSMNSSTSWCSSSRKYSATVSPVTYAQARARRFGHLAVNERALRLFIVVRINDPRFLHLEPQIVPFAGAFPRAGKHR